MIELQGLVRCMIKGVEGVDLSMFTLVTIGSVKSRSTIHWNSIFTLLIFAVLGMPGDIAPHQALASFYELQILKTSALGKFSIKNSQLRQVFAVS